MESRTRAFFCLCSCVLSLVHVRAGRADDFGQRREQLLEMLTLSAMLEGDIDSLGYSYRRRWQYYNACLARRVNLKEANRYFAESDEIVAEEWPVLLYLRTYFAFKDTVLSQAARERLAEVILDYKANAPRSRSIERFGVNGNHSIVAFSMYLLLDQEFGNGPKHDLVRGKFIEWVQYQGKYGRDEVNSPHYLERSLLPLLNLYDFIADPQLKLWAQMAIGQLRAVAGSNHVGYVLLRHAVVWPGFPPKPRGVGQPCNRSSYQRFQEHSNLGVDVHRSFENPWPQTGTGR